MTERVLPRRSPRDLADGLSAGAEPGAARSAGAAGAESGAAAADARADGRAAGAVRAVDVHRPVVAARGLRERGADPRARTAVGDPGHLDADHDPSRFGRGLLAAR